MPRPVVLWQVPPARSAAASRPPEAPARTLADNELIPYELTAKGEAAATAPPDTPAG